MSPFPSAENLMRKFLAVRQDRSNPITTDQSISVEAYQTLLSRWRTELTPQLLTSIRVSIPEVSHRASFLPVEFCINVIPISVTGVFLLQGETPRTSGAYASRCSSKDRPTKSPGNSTGDRGRPSTCLPWRKSYGSQKISKPSPMLCQNFLKPCKNCVQGGFTECIMSE